MTVDKDFSRIRVRPSSIRQGGWLAVKRALPGLALCMAGLAMLILVREQPAWLGPNVGPGLMAKLLAIGIIALGSLWAIWRAVQPEPMHQASGCGTAEGAPAERWSGPALLGAVLLFALSLPLFGLVISGSFAAALAAWGAGEREMPALAMTVSGIAVMILGIGLTLLPPTAPLWPAF